MNFPDEGRVTLSQTGPAVGATGASGWWLPLATVALWLGVVLPAHAERYRVDLIVFADKTGTGGERPQFARPPDLARVIDFSDSTQLRAAGIEVLPDDSFGLSKEWRHLANSQRHQPLLRLAWIQKDPPAENGPGLRLRSGSPLVLNSGGGRSSEIYPVDGSVRLLMGRFLHLDTDMAYTVTLETGELGSYRMQTRRRMRRDELHHIDSPRMGILARVQKAP